ncbi:hypothetical protein E1B28_006202 [Marasmius oreades]|uniref:DUF5745 domain-containing protein n=1 Tax=Marasmius oreades TaxID=181124 RepID=A0A9P7UV17_9AGAR|nr:uncharacterized protein E1B28_006202 [Marasmius oreades]KAG7095462.1 hypothetical protein E1B28_006202 [Marasmius oreades]
MALSLVEQLNDLLLYLNLPITLQSPTDLTPSLILALLESILQQRLSGISTDIRTCRSEESRILCVKLVLGILQTDILAGTLEQEHLNEFDLTGVNPERLARGEVEEVVRIARVLCWLGERMIVGKGQPQSQGHRDGNYRRSEPLSSPSIVTSNGLKSSHSPAFSPSSKSTKCVELELNAGVQDLSIRGILPHLSSFEEPLSTPQRRPRGVHRVPSPHLEIRFSPPLDDQISSSSSLSFPLTTVCLPPVRQHGFIGDVDEEEEFESFEQSRVEKSERSQQYPTDLNVDFEEAGHARTIALLKERARLLYRLAKLQQDP